MIDVSQFRVKNLEALGDPKSLEVTPGWDLPAAHVSPSSLNMALRCLEQYRQRYVLGRKEPPAGVLTLGTANHLTYEWAFQHVLDAKDLPPVKTTVEFFQDEAWPKAVERDGGRDEIVWKDKDHDESRRVGALMVETYRTEVAPNVRPLKLEEDFSLRLEGVPVPVVGKIDVVQEGPLPLIDVKTSGKAVNALKPGWVLQGRIYQLQVPNPVEWQVVTSAKTPKTSLIPQPWTENGATETRLEIARIVRTLQMLHSTLGPDEPWPATGIASGACGWCGYYSQCHARFLR